MTPKEELIRLIEKAGMIKGRSALSSKLQAILYVEPGELSLEELAKRVGYSLSAVSTAMKYLVFSGKVQRIRRPGSRKAFFYMDKDMFSMSSGVMKKLSKFTEGALNDIPRILERYRKEAPEAKGEIEIVKNYQKQMKILEGVFSDIVRKIEEEKV